MEPVRLQDDLALDIVDLVERVPVAVVARLELGNPVEPWISICHARENLSKAARCQGAARSEPGRAIHSTG